MASSVLTCFGRMEDPRAYRGRRHLLSDIMAIAILASICGASGFDEIEEFGKAKQKWLATFLKLPAGIPSDDTFARVFAALNPDAFEACFRAWVGAVAGATLGDTRHRRQDDAGQPGPSRRQRRDPYGQRLGCGQPRGLRADRHR